METRTTGATQNLWGAKEAESLSELEKLAFRSNLLGRDRAVANYGGGNTSTKARERDHAGQEVDVLWVKGSGSDLATIGAGQLTGLKPGEVLTLEEGEAVWIPYIRPGFALSKQVGEAVKSNPNARFVLLAKHGLVTWGDTHEESYGRTIEAINRAAEFVASRAGEPFGGRKVEPPAPERREELLAGVLPALRGALSSGSEEPSHKILRVDHTSEDVLAFVCGRDSKDLSQIGAACPDHLVRTKVRPLWVDFDPESEGIDELKAKLREGVARYREDYEAYFSRHEET